MPVHIRRAATADIPVLAAVAPTPRPFDALVQGDRTIGLVSGEGGVIRGYAFGELLSAPSVYDPGGDICLVEDLEVVDARDWPTVGAVLLRAVEEAAGSVGSVLTIVDCQHRDEPKRRMLAAAGACLVSEWWVRPLAASPAAEASGATARCADPSPVAARVRQATAGDIPGVVALAERRFEDYARAQPRFWRKAADSADRYTRRLERRLPQEQLVVLVAEAGGALRGYLIGELIPATPVEGAGGETCFVDGFAVVDSQGWLEVGSALLREVARRAAGRGAVRLEVVCGRHDESKRRMLARAGAEVVREWWVKER